MKNVMVAKGAFRLPNKFDYRSIFGGGHFGVSSGVSNAEGFKKQRYKIAFHGNAVDWVKERKWADDQKITETGDEVIITFTGSHFDKVLEWMLSRGFDARPLEPNDLVRVWRWTIKALGMKGK